MATHKFQLQFDPQKGSTYHQYKNLMKWFEERNIQYKFEHESVGHFYPKYVIVDDEHALLFKLSFKTVAVEK